MSETPLAIAEDLAARAEQAGATRLVCAGCSKNASPATLIPIRRLITHVINDHGRNVPPILTELQVEAISGWALAERLGRPPATTQEQAWRDDPREKVAVILQRLVDITKRHNKELAELSAQLTELGYEVQR